MQQLSRRSIITISTALAGKHGAAVFCGNGYNARAAAASGGENAFVMVGSMGLCAVIAAGFSASSGKPVLAIEGDGNALMGLSGYPVVCRAARAPFIHMVIDNGVYETTGGQLNLSPGVDWGAVARGAGYRHVIRATSAEHLEQVLTDCMLNPKVCFIHIQTKPEINPVIFPRVNDHPEAIHERFKAWAIK